MTEGRDERGKGKRGKGRGIRCDQVDFLFPVLRGRQASSLQCTTLYFDYSSHYNRERGGP